MQNKITLLINVNYIYIRNFEINNYNFKIKIFIYVFHLHHDKYGNMNFMFLITKSIPIIYQIFLYFY